MRQRRGGAAILSLFCLALFLALAVVVQQRALAAFDLEALLWLQDLFHPVPYAAGVALSVAGSVEIEFPLALAGVAWLAWRRLWRTALVLSLFFPLAGFSAILKLTVDQPGVPLELHRNLLAVFPSGDFYTQGSFPSGHMVRAGYLGGLAILVLWRRSPAPARSLALAATVALLALMAFSRPYLGEHWPTDIVGALLLDGAWLGAVAVFWPAPQPAQKARTAPEPELSRVG